jgi:hypothetical protein
VTGKGEKRIGWSRARKNEDKLEQKKKGRG